MARVGILLAEFARMVMVILTSWIRPTAPKDAPDGYHRWYYEKQIFFKVEYFGIPILKSVSDLWNYQEIIVQLKPRLIVETGTHAGGSALFFHHLLRNLGGERHVLTIDVTHAKLQREQIGETPIEFMVASSCCEEVARRITSLREEFTGPMFVILDSNHQKEHVLAELIMLRNLTRTGDYVIVEDSNTNGHPVAAGWGPGPFEAIEAYETQFPNDYCHDTEREAKFGFTFAVRGFLIRN